MLIGYAMLFSCHVIFSFPFPTMEPLLFDSLLSRVKRWKIPPTLRKMMIWIPLTGKLNSRGRAAGFKFSLENIENLEFVVFVVHHLTTLGNGHGQWFWLLGCVLRKEVYEIMQAHLIPYKYLSLSKCNNSTVFIFVIVFFNAEK